LSPSKERRYRITDTYLRFWLAFLGPHLAGVDRMRADLTMARIERSWTGWRVRAVQLLFIGSVKMAGDRPVRQPRSARITGRLRATWLDRENSQGRRASPMHGTYRAGYLSLSAISPAR